MVPRRAGWHRKDQGLAARTSDYGLGRCIQSSRGASIAKRGLRRCRFGRSERLEPSAIDIHFTRTQITLLSNRTHEFTS
jgi:hypothetical protein